jgi:HNH endonuclease.
MSKPTNLTSTLKVFGQLIKNGNFKRSSIKSSTGEAVYVNKNAEFVIVVKRISSSYGEPLVQYYYANTEKHRLNSTTGTGYYLIKLDKLRLIHRVVAETFFGEIANGYEVNHINEDKSDNTLNNLELVTRAENMKKYWENHKGNINKQYFGRYIEKTGRYTAPDGTKTSMTLDEYIDKVRIERGHIKADNIVRHYRK